MTCWLFRQRNHNFLFYIPDSSTAQTAFRERMQFPLEIGISLLFFIYRPDSTVFL
jgi:hypothetical protein